MKKLDLPTITNSFFVFCGSFFIFYSILVKNRIKYYKCAILSIFVSTLITAIFITISKFYQNNKKIKLLDKDILEKISYLAFYNKEKITELFVKYFSQENYKTTLKNGKIFIDNTIIIPMFRLEKINSYDVIDIINKYPNKKILILGLEYTDEAISIKKNKNFVYLYNYKDVFYSLEKHNLIEESSVKLQKKKTKEYFIPLFDKSKSGKFFLVGIVILLFSKFTYFGVFYIIVGSSFIILSIIARIYFPKKYEQPKGIVV